MQISPITKNNPNFTAKINWTRNLSNGWNDNITQVALGKNAKTAKAFEKILNKIDDNTEYSINIIENPVNYSNNMGACPFAVCRNGVPLFNVIQEGKRIIDEIFLQALFYDYPHQLLDTAISTGWLENTFKNARNAGIYLKKS